MLAADAELQAGPGPAPPLGGKLDQFADAVEIQRDERVLLDNALELIGGNEGGGIVARHAARGLGKIIVPEGEEFSRLRDAMGAPGGARQFAHRPGAKELGSAFGRYRG